MNKNKSECNIIITRKAFAKMKAITGHSDEVAAMCITHANQHNKIVDIFIPEQESNPAYFEFNSDQYGAAIEHLVMDVGYELGQVCKMMIHSHPGNSNTPSGTDWENFKSIYGEKELPVMLIISKDHKVSAHTIVPLSLWNEKTIIEITVLIEEESFNVSEIKEDIKKKVKPYRSKTLPTSLFSNSYKGYQSTGFYDDFKPSNDFYGYGKSYEKEGKESLATSYTTLEIDKKDMELIDWFDFDVEDVTLSGKEKVTENLIKLLTGSFKNSKHITRDIASVLVAAYANDIDVENGLYHAFMHLLLADHIQDDRGYFVELYELEKELHNERQE